MSLPTIYLIQTPQKQGFDLSSASKIGNVETVLHIHDKPSHCPGPCIKKLREKFKNFRKGDMVVWAGGDIAGVFYAGIVLGELSLSDVHILKWEREVIAGERTGGGYYVPMAIKLRRPLPPAKDHTIFY